MKTATQFQCWIRLTSAVSVLAGTLAATAAPLSKLHLIAGQLVLLEKGPDNEIGEPGQGSFRVLDHDAPNLPPSLELVTNEATRRFLVHARDPDGSIVRMGALDDETPLPTTFAQPVPGTEPDFWYVALAPTAWARGTLRLRAHDNAGGTATLDAFPPSTGVPFRVVSIPDERVLTGSTPVLAGSSVRIEFDEVPGLESVEFKHGDGVFVDSEPPWRWEPGPLVPGIHKFEALPSPGSVVGSGELTQVVVEGGPTLVWTEPLESVACENGEQPATFLLRRTGEGLAETLRIGLTTTTVAGTEVATPGLDFNLASEVDFPVGEDAVLVTVTPVDDDLEEPTETIAVGLEAPEGVSLHEAIRVVSLRDNDQNRIDPTLPVLQIISPEEGAVLPSTPLESPWFETSPGASEIPEGASIQWLASGVPVVSTTGALDAGYYTFTTRLIRANGTPGPESAPVRCRVASDPQGGDCDSLEVEILWPDSGTVFPSRSVGPVLEYAEVALVLRTNPPLEPEDQPDLIISEGRGAPITGRISLASYGAGIHVAEFSLVASRGRHLLKFHVSGHRDLGPCQTISGTSSPFILFVGEAGGGYYSYSSVTLGTGHLLLTGGRLFHVLGLGSNRHAPILPFPPATGWQTFGEGDALLAADTEGRLWKKERGWRQLIPSRPVSEWTRLAAGPVGGMGAGISTDGDLFVWGAAAEWTVTEEAGGSGTSDESPRRVPAPEGVTGWSEVALGENHALAISSDGRLFAWGKANLPLEALPPGSKWGWPPRVTRPTEVTPPDGVTGWRTVAAGPDTSFALASNGEIYAWGANSGGELFVAAAILPVLRPTPVVRPLSVTRWTRVLARPSLIAMDQGGAVYRGVQEHLNRMEEIPPIWPVARWVDLAGGMKSTALLGDEGSVYSDESSAAPGPSFFSYRPVANLGEVMSPRAPVPSPPTPSPSFVWTQPTIAAPQDARGPVTLAFELSDAGGTNALEVTAYTRQRGLSLALPQPVPSSGEVVLTTGRLNGGWNTVMLKAVAPDGRVGWSDPLHFVAAPAFVSPSRVGSIRDGPPYAISPTYHDDRLAWAYGSADNPEVFLLESSADLREWQEEHRLKAGDTKMFLPPMDQLAEDKRFYRLRWIESEY